ncbi:MAG: hypothetical protein RIQ52_824 [Pseudomonadota bacterium]|jgi:twitching motility protein PilT
MDILAELLYARSQGASDVHLMEGRLPRIRLHGEIRQVDGHAQEACCQLERSMQPLLSILAWEKYLRGEDVDFALDLPDVGRFRVNLFQTANGAGAVFRCIPDDPPQLVQLACPPVFESLLDACDGLILVAGATGSGKSTTLAAMLHHINCHQQRHIITIEDPIEYRHTSRKSIVSQREVGHHCPGFVEALRAALRQDPDVIMVGEMRDIESMRLAMTAAETGHLVMASLHARSAPQAIQRIIDVFPAGERDAVRCLLADALKAVIAQRLEPDAAGGRRALWEILVATQAVRHMVRENRIPQLHSVMQSGQQHGMQTWAQHRERQGLDASDDSAI